MFRWNLASIKVATIVMGIELTTTEYIVLNSNTTSHDIYKDLYTFNI